MGDEQTLKVTRKAPGKRTENKQPDEVYENKPDDLVYIREAARLLNRRQNTLRYWEYDGVLPDHLRSHRGERGWRYWTREQIEGIQNWIRETRRFTGNALPHYNPTEKQVDEAIAAMRDVSRKNNRAKNNRK